jgi:Na+-driven multidrug efflux pump
MVVSSAANGMGSALPSLIMSFLRLIGLYLPFIFIFSAYLQVAGIYSAAALANILVGLGAFIWYKRIKQRQTLVTS